MTRKHSTLVTAFTFAAVALAGASMAQASMTVNLEFAPEVGDPDGPHLKDLTGVPIGTIIEIRAYATITNDVAGGAINGSGDMEGLQFLAFNMLSQNLGGIQGQLQYRPFASGNLPQPPANPPQTQQEFLEKIQNARSLVAPFNQTGTQGGPQVVTGNDPRYATATPPIVALQLPDLNGDGARDVGSAADVSDASVIRPRSANAGYAFDADGIALQPTFQRVIPNGIEFLVARYDFVVGASSGGTLRYNPQVPDWILGSVKGANWWQNADPNGGTSDGFNNGTYFAGSGVTFTFVPEPGTLALLGLSLVGLVGYVRNRKHRD